MRSRVLTLIVAIVVALLAGVFAARYLSSAKAQIQAQGQPVTVLVAKQDVPAGVTADELLDKRYADLRQVPRQYVTDDAVSSSAGIRGQVLAVPLSRGEQLTTAQFKLAEEAGLAYSVPEGYVAVSITKDAASGVSSFLKPGDQVMTSYEALAR